MLTPKTHFEQVPVAVVKKMIVEQPEVMQTDDATEKIATDETESASDDANSVSQELDGGESGAEGWRGLAERVQTESDPEKMISLVELLIAKLDEEQQKQKPTIQSNQAGKGA